MEATAITAIFTAAATATNWKRTNIGLTVRISLGGYWYTVQLPSAERALIIGREGYGGTEHLNERATWPQTLDMVETAMAATRVR